MHAAHDLCDLRRCKAARSHRHDVLDMRRLHLAATLDANARAAVAHVCAASVTAPLLRVFAKAHLTPAHAAFDVLGHYHWTHRFFHVATSFVATANHLRPVHQFFSGHFV